MLLAILLPFLSAGFITAVDFSNQEVIHIKSDTPTITPKLSAYVEGLMKEWGVPGLSLGVVHSDGREVGTEYGQWGFMNEEGDKVTKETLFDIGSCSKAFVAAAIGILMDDFANDRNVTALPSGLHKFTYDTKVQALFSGEDSDWVLADEWATAKSNIRDVLGHVSGLPRHDLSYSAADSLQDVVRRMRYLKPAFELREQYSYNNQMYVLGAHIISIYSGKSYTAFVKERIFDPLGMSSTTFSGKEAEDSGHFSQAFTSGGRRIPFWFDNAGAAELIAGPGGILSSTVDMNKWLAMLLNEGIDPRTNITVIPKFAFDEVTTARYIVSGKPVGSHTSIVGYGMGWGSFSYKGYEIVTHSGGLPGFLTIVAFLPSQRLGIVVLINQGQALSVNAAVMFHIIDHLEDPEQPALWRRQRLSPLIQDNPMLDSLDVQRPILPPRTEALHHSSPAVHLDGLAGEYSNAGYGSFTLCTSTTNISDACDTIISEFAAVYPDLPADALYASWPRIWTSHLRLWHVGGNAFKFGVTKLFPHGYGKDTSPFEERVFGDVDFDAVFDIQGDVVKGMAILGGFEYLDDLVPQEGDLTDRADLFFARV